jgi:hypothetical protein
MQAVFPPPVQHESYSGSAILEPSGHRTASRL